MSLLTEAPGRKPRSDEPSAEPAHDGATVNDERMTALEDRVLYLEAALHHVLDAIGLSPFALPDPFASERPVSP
jgi:hypothetical protein